MKPSKKRSAYQLAFAKPNAALVKSLYEEGVRFRNKRRDENRSCQFSLKWDSEDDESEDSQESVSDVTEEDTGDYQGIYIKQSKDSSKQLNNNKTNEETFRQEITPNKTKLEKKARNLVVLSSSTDTGTTITHEDSSSTSNQNNSRRRPRSALDCCDVRKQKPAFAQYGSGNQCKTIGGKKSFNTRLSPNKKKKKSRKMRNTLDKTQSLIELYTAIPQESLAVACRREKSCKKQSKFCSGQVKKGYFCQVSIRKKSDTSEWMSEYRRCFSRLSLDTGVAGDASTSSTLSLHPSRRRKR